ncbi:PAS/PAC and GAF sensor-containing diguanylate cyclase/phosphodiesterase [Candidatus Magnetoovum chiemensis]|nr:PAS/PAC and GAF sensor-containing diguanylate cyclase/phosphodiesterase [Candidatus Magnetoovum chiemensis]
MNDNSKTIDTLITEINSLKIETASLKAQNNTLKEHNDELVNSIIRIKNETICSKLFSNLHLLIAYMDTSFNFIRVNKAYAKADNKTEDFYIGKNHFELYPNEENKNIFKNVIETGSPYFAYAKPFVYENNTERGVTYWDWSLHPVMDRNNAVGLLMCLIDVTKNIELEIQLKTERDTAHKYLDRANVIIVVINTDETVRFINKRGLELLKYKKDQIIGKNWFEYFIPNRIKKELRTSFKTITKQSNKDKYDYSESLIIDGEGNERLIGWNNSLLYDKDKAIAVLSAGEDITERKALEKELKESHMLLQSLMHNSPDSIYFKDKDHRFVKVNKAKANHNLTTPEEMIGKRDYDYFAPETAKKSEDDEKEIMVSKKYINNKMEKIERKDGSHSWVLTNKVPWCSESGEIVGIIGITRDVTQSKELEIELQQSLHTQNVLNSILITLMESLTLDDILYRVLEMLVTLPWLAIEPKGCVFLVDEDDNTLVMRTEYGLNKELLKACAILPFGKCLCGRAAVTKEIVFYSSITDEHEIKFDGMKPHGHYCIPIIYKDKLYGVLNLYVKHEYKRTNKEDIFLTSVAHTLANMIEFKRTEEKVQYMAKHDVLTKLPNRSLFYDRLQNITAHAKRYGHKFAIMFIDLDSFKPINDTYGHHIGDMLLEAVASKIKEHTRESDTTARIGGDEFVVILPYIAEKVDIIVVATKILKSIAQPHQLDGKECSTTASIGIAIFPEDGNDADLIIKSADTAMYDAKENGGNNFKFYSHRHNGNES